jgi:hypothetical protein
MLSRRAWLDDGLLAPTLAHAQGTQGFPSRNLTVIVPFAGRIGRRIARLVGEKLGDAMTSLSWWTTALAPEAPPALSTRTSGWNNCAGSPLAVLNPIRRSGANPDHGLLDRRLSRRS